MTNKMEPKKGLGTHRPIPIKYCVFTYQDAEEDESGHTIKWHVRCPFCNAALTISASGMEIDKRS